MVGSWNTLYTVVPLASKVPPGCYTIHCGPHRKRCATECGPPCKQGATKVKLNQSPRATDSVHRGPPCKQGATKSLSPHRKRCATERGPIREQCATKEKLNQSPRTTDSVHCGPPCKQCAIRSLHSTLWSPPQAMCHRVWTLLETFEVAHLPITRYEETIT